MSAIEFLEQLAELDYKVEDNALIAGRLPPKITAGLHPENYPIWAAENGGVFKLLQDVMPEPMVIPKVGSDFGNVASTPSPTSNNAPTMEPKLTNEPTKL